MTYIPVGAQNEVITTTASASVVLGGAGTGKTVTAAAAAAAHIRARDSAREQQRRKLITDGKAIALPPKARVLFLSFSRTAVAQVIDRASRVVGPLLDRIEVVTFDGVRMANRQRLGRWVRIPAAAAHPLEGGMQGPGAPHRDSLSRDLVPAALKILANPAVCSHYDRRYSLVICDEFQDTDDEESRFLTAIAPTARRILLGDANQCIYAEMKGIDPNARIAEALALPGAVRSDLPAASHRDPSGVLPAAADAARERRFDEAPPHPRRLGRPAGRDRVTDSPGTATVVELVKAERANDERQRVHPQQRIDDRAVRRPHGGQGAP